ncbi:C6 zinc finger domain-containing protein [Nannizzia gypsea CBS 118893]|uniref:C6 zinc finger domain-containing protein n=1 Tax=Arthroderma gypseum (strain ATCC MYA-4604 / CBS 118893) TaxID=535722 RepID=E4UU41_ARTGP|nr:C6 zinc finger domain-containing protein [Nannizzia gypsea CBS 118893]EFR00808.1 C6 zinc finger domain-containing protein [Nannizzia gypsea CBS 118893]
MTRLSAGLSPKGTDRISSGRSASQSYPPSLTEGSTNKSVVVNQPSHDTGSTNSTRAGSGENKPYNYNPNTQKSSSAYISAPRILETSSQIGGTFHIHRRAGIPSEPLAISGAITHKGRSFGQSHWINMISLFEDICGTVERHLQYDQSVTLSNVEKCKALARTIKSRRIPTGPIRLTSDLPSKKVSDELVDCYIQTIESIYRILHIPTFKMDYEALFLSADETAPDITFLAQVKLVLAIGAVTYDKNFSLRVLATRWIYETQAWLFSPTFKSRFNIQSLQSYLLLLFAQEMVGIDGDPMWVSVGTLLRRAIYMGLHKDPDGMPGDDGKPGNTLFVTEMRRRIWNTILEVCLQSSLTSGGPPLFSLDDFDTKPPRNFDDKQIKDSAAIQKDEFTQASISIALRETLPQRLAVITFLNSHGSSLSSCTYEVILQLDKELRSGYKSLCKTIQDYTRSPYPSSLFEFRTVDLIMQQYLLCLHVPFFGLSSAYAFTRKVTVEAAFKIWHSTYQTLPFVTSRPNECPRSSTRDHSTLLATCGSGFYRTIMLQAALVIAAELRSQIRNSESLGPIPLSQDLFTVLENAKAWSIQSLLKDPTEDYIPGTLIGALEDASAASLSILNGVATLDPVGNSTDTLHEMPLDNMSDVTEDWRFMVADSIFNLDCSSDIMHSLFGTAHTAR